MRSNGGRGAAVAALLSSIALTLGLSVSPASADGTTPPPSTGATGLGAFPSSYPVCDGGINESDPLNLGTDDWQCDLPGPSELNSSLPLATIIGQLYYPNGSPVYQPFEVPTGNGPTFIQEVTNDNGLVGSTALQQGTFNNWFGREINTDVASSLETAIAPSWVGLSYNGSGYTFVGFPNDVVENGDVPADSPFASLVNVVAPSNNNPSSVPDLFSGAFLSPAQGVGAGAGGLADEGNMYVPGPPIPVGTCTPDYDSEPGTYDCSASGTNDYRNLSYTWTFPDGSTETGSSVVYESDSPDLTMGGTTELTASASDGWSGTIDVDQPDLDCVTAQNADIEPPEPNVGQTTTITTQVSNYCGGDAAFTTTVTPNSDGQFLGDPSTLESSTQTVDAQTSANSDNTVAFAAAGDNPFAVTVQGTIGDGQWPFITTDGGDDITVATPGQSAPSIVSAATTMFTVGQAGTFPVLSSDGNSPADIALSESGALPNGVTFVDNGDDTATLAGTPAAGSMGIYQVGITATNGIAPDAQQLFTLYVHGPPAIISTATTTFSVGQSGSYTIQSLDGSSGSPDIHLTETGALPRGVTFVDNGDDTATLAGTPAKGSSAAYPVTLTASNGISPDASQAFTLNVQTNTKPAFTSPATATATVGTQGTIDLSAAGLPTPTISTSTILPSGLQFTAGSNGTATISGTPAAGTGKTYTVALKATNSVGSATQKLVLTVDEGAAITSAASKSATVGKTVSFKVTSSGFPTAALTESGALPTGVQFTAGSAGTATITGTPAAGTAGTYDVTITATNGVGSAATQAFVLTVNQVPAFTSPATATATVGTQGTIDLSAAGLPTPTISTSTILPSGLQFTAGSNGTATISGTPAAGTGKTYTVALKATNSVGSATQKLVLTVDEGAAITSAASKSATVGKTVSFKVTSSGFPTAALTESGALPTGVQFTAGSAGTATITGTPAAGTAGTYDVTITATNGVGSAATQAFVLTVTAKS